LKKTKVDIVNGAWIVARQRGKEIGPHGIVFGLTRK